METVVEQLVTSTQPGVAWLAHTCLLDYPVDSPEASAARQVLCDNEQTRALLAAYPGGKRTHPYFKWTGAHWILAQLTDLGWPPGDERLRPLLNDTLTWLTSASHYQAIQVIEGKTRRCASQEGNALLSSLALGLADARTEKLAADLVAWQWPDGGWNCDRRKTTRNSSYHETWLPARALLRYARESGDPAAQRAAERACDLFLERALIYRKSTGELIEAEFGLLHYPAYWHYDLLQALWLLMEAGRLSDPRCARALDLLESKRLPGGGYPADGRRYYQSGKTTVSGYSPANWGPAGKTKMNEQVTVRVLIILRAAGRWQPA